MVAYRRRKIGNSVYLSRTWAARYSRIHWRGRCSGGSRSECRSSYRNTRRPLRLRLRPEQPGGSHWAIWVEGSTGLFSFGLKREQELNSRHNNITLRSHCADISKKWRPEATRWVETYLLHMWELHRSTCRSADRSSAGSRSAWKVDGTGSLQKPAPPSVRGQAVNIRSPVPPVVHTADGRRTKLWRNYLAMNEKKGYKNKNTLQCKTQWRCMLCCRLHVIKLLLSIIYNTTEHHYIWSSFTIFLQTWHHSSYWSVNSS